MSNKTTRIIIFISFFFLFSVFLYRYLSLNLWDYDFWWHIGTGRYIVENRHLPETDPFSFTSGLEENKNLIPERESFILKQYWISQIIFFFIYQIFDCGGIIIFRTFVFLLIISAVLWRLIKNGVSFYICFICVFLVHLTTLSFTSERPVLFTMLFSVVIFLLLEEFRIKRNKSTFYLIPLMLLWSNMHGGFILGDVIIVAFIIGETLGIILKKSVYTRKELLLLYLPALCAITISALNPNGFEAFSLVLSPKYKIFKEGIQEHLPTFLLYKNNLRPLDIGYVSLVVLMPLILVLRARKMNIYHILLILGLFIMSIISFRFIIYFVIISSVILGTELHFLIVTLLNKGVERKNRERLAYIFCIVTLLSSITLFFSSVHFRCFDFKEASRYSVPVRAVDFIEGKRLSGNLYNDFVYGGYITWRLYPWKKNFIDTRSINYTVLSEARWINFAIKSINNKEIRPGALPLWEKLLDHYKIDIIMLDTLNVQGSLAPLILKLLDNKKWVPVYVDSISVVFVRDSENNQAIIRKYRIQKETVLNAIIGRAVRGALTNKRNPNYLVSLGDIYLSMGRMEDALIAYERAIERMPPDSPLRIKIEEIKNKI